MPDIIGVSPQNSKAAANVLNALFELNNPYFFRILEKEPMVKSAILLLEIGSNEP
jgi:hypothetical protein